MENRVRDIEEWRHDMNQWRTAAAEQIASQGRAITALESNQTQLTHVMGKMAEHVDKTTSILDKIQGGWGFVKWVVPVLLTLIALEIGLSHAGKLAKDVGWLKHSVGISRADGPQYASKTSHASVDAAGFEFSLAQ